MKHPLPVRSLLIALIALAVLLIHPMPSGAESQPTVTATATPTATATRRIFSWPTVAPTPTATAAVTTTVAVTATARISATTATTVTATVPVTGTAAITATDAITDTITDTVPVRLRIPAIDVDATIEPVGQDRNGRMDTPSLVDDVAWYEPGVAPGEIGNAVLAGHLDRIGGAPAVFWKLGKLAAGDDIFVTDSAGGELHFRVTGVESYPYDAAPMNDIFGFGIRSRLNLITCRGKWDRAGQTYTQRLVVYSELVGDDSAPAQ